MWEKEEYKHVYQAMKKSRDEIAESIDQRKLILFETIPLDFNEGSVDEYYYEDLKK